MDNNTLAHYGVPGMKWGVRRYRNEDGSLTAAGKRRAERDMSELSKTKQKAYVPNANKWVKDDLSRSKRLVEETGQMANKLKSANEKAARNKPKKTMDLSNMTDKEMRDQINRALLEKQYNDMFAPQNTSRGRDYANQILDSAGDVLAITASALGIALAIKELRG